MTIAAILETAVIERILDHLGLPAPRATTATLAGARPDAARDVTGDWPKAKQLLLRASQPPWTRDWPAPCVCKARQGSMILRVNTATLPDAASLLQPERLDGRSMTAAELWPPRLLHWHRLTGLATAKDRLECL